MYKIDKYIPPRNLIPISNQIKEIGNFSVAGYYINEHECNFIIRRLDEDEGWNFDLFIEIDKTKILIGKSNTNTLNINIVNNDIEFHKVIFKEQKIPKVIIQTSDSDEVTLQHYNSVMTFVDLNPEYTYKFFDSKDRRELIKNNFNSDILNAYDMLIPGAYQADLFRVCALLYLKGGCYFDCKMILKVPLRDIILQNDTEILLQDCNNNRNANGIIITIHTNTFLINYINEIVKNVNNNFYGKSSIDITGPVCFNKFTNHIKPRLKNNFHGHDNPLSTIIELETGKLIAYPKYKNYYKIMYSNNYYDDLWNQRKVYYKVIIENEFFRILSQSNILKNSIIIKNNYLINLNNFDIESKVIYKSDNSSRELTIFNNVIDLNVVTTKNNISFIGFWEGFNKSDNFITNNLDNYRISNIYQANIIFIGVFINKKEWNNIKNLNAKKCLVITEPIGKDSFEFPYSLLDKVNFVTGAIKNDTNKFYKLPIYLSDVKINECLELFKNTNSYVMNCNINDKKYATLINTHDRGNTRTPIYNLLKNISKIDCPSKLFNNMNSSVLPPRNKLGTGNAEFIKNYIFNICPENYKCNFEGYITEKIFFACLGGAIPIYFGSFDDIDAKIFNRDRIIFYDPENKDSLDNAYNKVKFLYENKDELEKFYRKKVFMDTAYDTLLSLKYNFNIIKIENKIYNSSIMKTVIGYPVGGLGNQLFIIANAYAYGLKNNFTIKISETWRHIREDRPSYWNTLLTKVRDSNYLINESFIDNIDSYNEPSFGYTEIPKFETTTVLKGYFQSPLYFDEYRNEICNLFELPDTLKKFAENKLNEFITNNDTLVCVHIRRGDYVQSSIHLNLSVNYYENAKLIIEEKLGFRPTYLYFSDDKKFITDNFKLENKDSIIECDKDYEEFAVMQYCQHFIIANSTFSWWASYLSKYKDKLVIMPKKWFEPSGPKEISIYTKDCIILDS